MSYETVSENRVSLSHTKCTSGLGVVRPLCHDKSYVRHNTVRPLCGFLRENLIFSPLSAYSPTPKATRNTLKPSSLVNNLHAM
jgi:hypothetical protein